MPTLEEWIESRDPKYREEARTLLGRITAIAPEAPVIVRNDGLAGFGDSGDGYFLIGMAVRKDGLRLYASVRELKNHTEALGKKLTGKSCVTLKRSDDLTDDLLVPIVTGSLSAPSIAVE
jgi:uncharacterized protein YdhG (YjbR/CyaY superfamily)